MRCGMAMQKENAFSEFSWPSVTVWHFFGKWWKVQRFQAYLALLKRYHREGNVFLYHIATGERRVGSSTSHQKQNGVHFSGNMLIVLNIPHNFQLFSPIKQDIAKRRDHTDEKVK